MNDTELLKRYAAGEEGAFQELVSQYKDSVYAFLRRFLSQSDLLDDVFQETFMQLYVSRDTFDQSRPLRPWLFTIAANKARDLLRSRGRKREVSIENPIGWGNESGTAADFLPAEYEAPTDVLSREEESQRVREIVMLLPESLREVLLLAYFHRFPYKDIAEILGVPIGTVKSRLHSAVSRFRQDYVRITGRTDIGDGELPS